MLVERIRNLLDDETGSRTLCIIGVMYHIGTGVTLIIPFFNAAVEAVIRPHASDEKVVVGFFYHLEEIVLRMPILQACIYSPKCTEGSLEERPGCHVGDVF